MDTNQRILVKIDRMSKDICEIKSMMKKLLNDKDSSGDIVTSKDITKQDLYDLMLSNRGHNFKKQIGTEFIDINSMYYFNDEQKKSAEKEFGFIIPDKNDNVLQFIATIENNHFSNVDKQTIVDELLMIHYYLLPYCTQYIRGTRIIRTGNKKYTFYQVTYNLSPNCSRITERELASLLKYLKYNNDGVGRIFNYDDYEKLNEVIGRFLM